MPNGNQVLLSQFNGKIVLLAFLLTTCPHCQHTSQVFTQIQKEYGPRGFQALDVAFNDMANLYVPDFVKSFSVGYPVSFASRDEALEYLKYSVMQRYVVPQIVWIDRKGDIRSQTGPMGDDNNQYQESYWRNMIDTLLKESGSGAAKKTTTHHDAAPKKTPTT